MATSVKKGKKSKGTVISLQSFLSNGDAPVGTTQVAKNIRNADGEDSDDGGNVHTVVCQLPTAPRANRIFDDSSIPHKPPFIAYVTNLPFDVKESDIYEFFSSCSLKSVRLPREDGETGRVRGFGYAEFENRDDLLHALSMRDPAIKGRRVRIDLSSENETNLKQRGARRGYEAGSNTESRELSNWRSDNAKRDSFNFVGERSTRDQKYTSEENNSPGSWRLKNQNSSTKSSSVDRLHQRDQNEYVDKNKVLERPKLNLKPRTLPLPELDIPLEIETKDNNIDSIKFSGTPAEKVFGSAKPVDTTARDLEIEKRLADVRRHDSSRKEISKIANDMNELSVVKEDKANKNLSWRRQSKNVETMAQDRKGLKTDTHKEYRIKNQGKSEGSDIQKNSKDEKRKDSNKIKCELKPDRQFGKNNRNQSDHQVVSVNKYSGLYDDSD